MIVNDNLINVRIFDRKVSALIDTGSDVSIISESLLNNIRKLRKCKLFKSSYKIVTLPDGRTLPILGCLRIPVFFTNRAITMQVYVLKELKQDLIIGHDFLRRNGAIIDFMKRKVTLRPSSLIRASKTYSIPARSECVISARVRGNYPNGIVGHTTNTMSLAHIGIATARVLGAVQNGRVPVRLVNCKDTPVKLRRGTRLGNFRILPDGTDIHTFDTNVSRNGPVVRPNRLSKQEFLKAFDFEDSTLTSDQVLQLQQVLWKNKDAFVDDTNTLGYCDIIKHRINLKPGSKTVSRPPYKASPDKREEIKRQIDKLLDQGLVVPSTSPYSSPVLLVRKPNGEFRMVIDYRMINSITEPIAFPLPGIKDTLDIIGSKCPKYFSTLDLSSGFWQIAIHPDDVHKTSFVSHYGKFAFKVLPMGMMNSSASFQNTIQFVLINLLNDSCCAYMDDILAFSATFEDHLIHIDEVLTRLREANLKLGPRKCVFGRREVKFLGHRVNEHGVMADPSKLEAVKNFPTPKSVTELKSFLGLANFYRKFIKDFAKIAHPLHGLLRKGVDFVWSRDCEIAFDTLKTALISPPVLAHPRFNEEFILYTDASSFSVGYVLAQIQEGVEKPICYGGRALSKPQQNYTVTEREFLALIHALSQCEQYLHSVHFTVITDHANLPYLIKTTEPSGRLARWVLRIQGFDFDIVHRSGCKIPHADSLSRRVYDDGIHNSDVTSVETAPAASNTQCVQVPSTDKIVQESSSNKGDVVNTQSVDNDPVVDIPTLFTISNENSVDDMTCLTLDSDDELIGVNDLNDNRRTGVIADRQRNDNHLRPLIDFLESGDLPTDDRHAKRIASISANYVIIDRVLYHFWTPNSNKSDKDIRRQLVVPKDLRLLILRRLHDDVTGGHLGVLKTLGVIRQRYFWDTLIKDVHKYVNSCVHCQMRKPGHRIRAPLLPIPVTGLFDRIAIDFCGPFHVTKSGNSYVLVITEYLSKFAWAFPTKNMTAITVANILFEHIFTNYGFPNVILSDQGPCFNSQIMREFCRFFDVSKRFGTAYRPQTQGIVEKFNSTLLGMLSMFVADRGDDWDSYLAAVLFAYRVAPHHSTGVSPFSVLFGMEPRLPLDVTLLPAVSKSASINFHLKELASKRNIAIKMAMDNIKVAQEKMKEHYDKRAVQHEFTIGDIVYLYNPAVKPGRARKFHKYYRGPYRIADFIPPLNYRLRYVHSGKLYPKLVHHNRLKKGSLRSTSLEGSTPDVDLGDTDTDTDTESPQNSGGFVPPRRSQAPTSPSTETESTESRNSDSSSVSAESQSSESASVSASIRNSNDNRYRYRRRRNKPSSRVPIDYDSDSLAGENEPAGDDTYYRIDKILRGRHKNGILEYLVKWEGYPSSDNSWIPESYLNDEAIKSLRDNPVVITGKRRST